MRLDDGNLSWTDLHAFIWSAPPTSATFNSVERGWSTTDHMLAGAVDLLAVLAWQNTADAQSNFPRHRPEPLSRPSDGDKQEPTSAPIMSGIGGMSASVMSVEEFQQRIQDRRRVSGD